MPHRERQFSRKINSRPTSQAEAAFAVVVFKLRIELVDAMVL